MLNKEQQIQLIRDSESYTNQELITKYNIPDQMLRYYFQKLGIKRVKSLKKLTKQKADYIRFNMDKDDKLISMILDVPEYRVKIFKERIVNKK